MTLGLPSCAGDQAMNLVKSSQPNVFRTPRVINAMVLACLFCTIAANAGAQTSRREPSSDDSQRSPVGPGKVVVHTALGGEILGYDIDQTGTEGLLSEFVALNDGNSKIAVETFDQKTGRIVKVVNQQNNTSSAWETLGVFGNHVGLAELEQEANLRVDKRAYLILNPLSSNQFTARWTPPLNANDIIVATNETQGSSTTAMLFMKNTGDNFSSYVLSSNIAANTFGPVVQVPDPIFDWDLSPVIAINSTTNQAVLGSSTGCVGPQCTTEIGLVDLTLGTFTEFEGLGLGSINGIAVDSNTGIACTTTEVDFNVEFYDLAAQTGIIVPMAGAVSQAQSGQAVAIDPIHKLFLIGQEFSSTSPSGSSIQVFDEQGDVVESLNGFSLPASPVNLALNPSLRLGFVYGGTTLQSFTY